MTLSTLEESIQICRRCESTLCKYGVEPRPIFSGGVGYPIFLLGQAPGKTEYDKRAPFQGDAGKSIKAQFAASGLSNFERTVYQTSVTKCFPGRRPGASTDRMPSAGEVKNCLPFLERQLELMEGISVYAGSRRTGLLLACDRHCSPKQRESASHGWAALSVALYVCAANDSSRRKCKRSTFAVSRSRSRVKGPLGTVNLRARAA